MTQPLSGVFEKAETLVRSEKTCVSEGESPSSPEVRLPEFRTKVMNGKANQLPKTEGCSAEGEPVDLLYYRVERPVEKRTRVSVSRKRDRIPLKQLSLESSRRKRDGVRYRNNTERPAPGEGLKGLPGSKSVARAAADARNRGGPESPCRTNCEGQAGRTAQRQEAPSAVRESDRPVVSSGKARAPTLEKEPTCWRSTHRQPCRTNDGFQTATFL